MPSDFALKTMNAVHRGLLAISFGRLGGKTFGMPVLELTTTGRKSGEPRTVMLTSPVQDGDTIAIIASRGGDDRHPDWFLNLQAKPEVDVTFIGKDKQRMRARVATPEEKAKLWPQVTAAYKGYANYQTKTDRDIPVVLLEPAGG